MLTVDEIREAVGLVDGYNLTWEVWLSWPYSEQMYLDALRCQLERQVDAAGYLFCSYFEGGAGIEDSNGELVEQATGPDRTENTIRVILQSKVLKEVEG